MAVEDGRATPMVSGQTVDYALCLSRHGARLAFRAVDGRATGDLSVLETASGH